MKCFTDRRSTSKLYGARYYASKTLTSRGRSTEPFQPNHGLQRNLSIIRFYCICFLPMSLQVPPYGAGPIVGVMATRASPYFVYKVSVGFLGIPAGLDARSTRSQTRKSSQSSGICSDALCHLLALNATW